MRAVLFLVLASVMLLGAVDAQSCGRFDRCVQSRVCDLECPGCNGKTVCQHSGHLIGHCVCQSS